MIGWSILRDKSLRKSAFLTHLLLTHYTRCAMLRKQLTSLGGRRAFSSSAPARRVVATGPVKAQEVDVRYCVVWG